MGTVIIELYWKHASNTCRNFAELARRGYYNGTKFHRIIKDFMIQGGDPTATGKNEKYYLLKQLYTGGFFSAVIANNRFHFTPFGNLRDTLF